MPHSKTTHRSKFKDVWEKVRDELTNHFANDLKLPKGIVLWYQKNLDYNVPGGKLHRGLMVVNTFEILMGRELSEEEYFKTAVLGWCVDSKVAFLVADDVMDNSITRRGHSCYYRLPNVGLLAVNDSFLLEGAIYELLRSHFRKEPCYVDLLELFHRTSYQSEIGQLIDMVSSPETEVDLSKFSLERYRLIALYKSSYYSFFLPVGSAMLFAGVPEEYDVPTASGTEKVNPYKLAQEILLPLGEYFQIQDDFLDFAGDPEKIGKIGTDIVDNKCSWVINTAIQHASPAQRAILDESYGRKDSEKEAKVKAVFEELDIRGRYATYVNEKRIISEFYERVGVIEEVEGGLKKKMFTSILENMHTK